MGGPLGPPCRVSGVPAGAMLLVSACCSFPRTARESVQPRLPALGQRADGAILWSPAVLAAIGALIVIGVFLYLFRAAMARGAAVPRWFVYLIVERPSCTRSRPCGPRVEVIDIADKFAAGADSAATRARSRTRPQQFYPATRATSDSGHCRIGVPVRDAPVARPAGGPLTRSWASSAWSWAH